MEGSACKDSESKSLAFSGTGVPCAPETWRWSLGWMEREHQVDLCGRD